MLSISEIIVLQLLLSKNKSESHGFELVQKSDGLLTKGSIYKMLFGMEHKGYLKSRIEKVTIGYNGLPSRRLYKTTIRGKRMLDSWEKSQIKFIKAWD